MSNNLLIGAAVLAMVLMWKKPSGTPVTPKQITMNKDALLDFRTTRSPGGFVPPPGGW